MLTFRNLILCALARLCLCLFCLGSGVSNQWVYSSDSTNKFTCLSLKYQMHLCTWAGSQEWPGPHAQNNSSELPPAWDEAHDESCHEHVWLRRCQHLIFFPHTMHNCFLNYVFMWVIITTALKIWIQQNDNLSYF